MLRYLLIRDFAIIELIELDLAAGLTVLTGESGAGKSIIVDALELLAGARASADVVRPGAERADISATIDPAAGGTALRALLERQAIDCGDELVMRRVVGADGRSRAWLNGQPVPLQMLKDAAELLFDIHGQHEFQSLARAAEQRSILDAYGQLQGLGQQVAAAHAEWLALMNRSVQLESAADERTSRLDLLRYQVQEVEALQLAEGEFSSLQEERTRLSHRGRLISGVREALGHLYESEEATAQGLLGRAGAALRAAAASDARLCLQAALVDEAQIRVQDASRALQQYLDAIELDPQRADEIERRLAAIEELARKHRVPPQELPARGASLHAELLQLEHAAADLGSVRAQLATALSAYLELARQLSARRATAARALAKQISTRMQELGMGGGRFLIEVQPASGAEPAAHGLDRVEFRVSTNPGQPPRPLAKVASGGELSRLSLAVQVSGVGQSQRTMVFDEVDAGIGGAVAEIVGRELRALAGRAQVLCVTHLPQVAAQGHQHLRVTKHAEGGRTRTAVMLLSPIARVEEVARMLGGVEITARARAHAREMLAQAEKPASEKPASTQGEAAAKTAVSPRPASSA